MANQDFSAIYCGPTTGSVLRKDLVPVKALGDSYQDSYKEQKDRGIDHLWSFFD